MDEDDKNKIINDMISTLYPEFEDQDYEDKQNILNRVHLIYYKLINNNIEKIDNLEKDMAQYKYKMRILTESILNLFK